MIFLILASSSSFRIHDFLSTPLIHRNRRHLLISRRRRFLPGSSVFEFLVAVNISGDMVNTRRRTRTQSVGRYFVSSPARGQVLYRNFEPRVVYYSRPPPNRTASSWSRTRVVRYSNKTPRQRRCARGQTVRLSRGANTTEDRRSFDKLSLATWFGGQTRRAGPGSRQSYNNNQTKWPRRDSLLHDVRYDAAMAGDRFEIRGKQNNSRQKMSVTVVRVCFDDGRLTVFPRRRRDRRHFIGFSYIIRPRRVSANTTVVHEYLINVK